MALWYGIGLVLFLAMLMSVRFLLVARAELTAERERSRKWEREMRLATALVNRLEAFDWQCSATAILEVLVGEGAGRAAGLLAVSEQSGLEVWAMAAAPGELPWADADLSPEAHRALETRAIVHSGGAAYLPLLEADEPIGVLAIRHCDSGAPFLEVAARLCGTTLSQIRSFRRQTNLSNTDGLTGLSNHRHFQQALGIAMGQSYLDGQPLAIILLDIDHFKQVNDLHGHLFGDLMLRELAYVLRKGLPPDALAARYGGEEMVVLLKGEAAVHAPQMAEDLRKAIQAHVVQDFNTSARLAVTVSMGVALHELGEGKNSFVARADAALYASKRTGRNRVTLADPINGTSTRAGE